MPYNISYTRHILQDSSIRIKDTNVNTEDEIKKYYRNLFSCMYNGNKIGDCEPKIYWDPDDEKGRVGKIVCAGHKFVFRKYENEDGDHFLLITYAYKRDIDKLEHHLLYIINKCKNYR